MSYTFATWYPAERCTGGAEDGARALMRWVLDNVDGAASWGIYACRETRSGGSYSPHAEGRALDIRMPMDDSRGSAAGHRLVDLLGEAGRRLGVQAIIYDRTIWSKRSPDGRRYGGVHPHYDHVHVEITRSAADELTLATVRAVMGEASGSRYETYARGVEPGSRTVGKFRTRPWSAGDDVAELQRIVNAWYPQLTALDRDGHFGPLTDERVRYLQHRARITVDGICGPVTWGVLGVE